MTHTTQERAAQAAQDSALMRALGLAHHWQRRRMASLTAIAVAEGIDRAQASKIIRLRQLAPDLVEALTAGYLEVSVGRLLRGKQLESWQAQRGALGGVAALASQDALHFCPRAPLHKRPIRLTI